MTSNVQKVPLWLCSGNLFAPRVHFVITQYLSDFKFESLLVVLICEFHDWNFNYLQLYSKVLEIWRWTQECKWREWLFLQIAGVFGVPRSARTNESWLFLKLTRCVILKFTSLPVSKIGQNHSRVEKSFLSVRLGGKSFWSWWRNKDEFVYR